MSVNDPCVDIAMNAAVEYLEQIGSPVSPESQYHVLETWHKTLTTLGDSDLNEIRAALSNAMERVSKHISSVVLD